MAALSTGFLCDGNGCLEFFKGPTFPSAIAAQTWAQAFAIGWRRTGRPRDGERRDLCPACAKAGGHT